jgi:hypothetical protein
MVGDITKCQKTSPCKRTQEQTNEARNDPSGKTEAASGDHENPKHHVEEITVKNPPTENVVSQETPKMVGESHGALLIGNW